MLCPARITLENKVEIRPQPDRENAFAKASGGGDGTEIQRSPSLKLLILWAYALLWKPIRLNRDWHQTMGRHSSGLTVEKLPPSLDTSLRHLCSPVFTAAPPSSGLAEGKGTSQTYLLTASARQFSASDEREPVLRNKSLIFTLLGVNLAFGLRRPRYRRTLFSG